VNRKLDRDAAQQGATAKARKAHQKIVGAHQGLVGWNKDLRVKNETRVRPSIRVITAARTSVSASSAEAREEAFAVYSTRLRQ